MRVVVDKAIPFIAGVLEQYAEVEYVAGGEIYAATVRDCDALIVRTRTRCNESLLAGSKVKFIATATIGTDHIDELWCAKNGITVARATGCNARGVLQWVAAVLKHICTTDNKEPSKYTLGVVGVGNVGSLVVEYARHWGFHTLMCDPPRKEREGGDFISIDEIATRCDIITLHTPLDNTTRHLVDSNLISCMPRHSIIINASRGAVVDNRAVECSAHRYIFDVWEEEPNIAGDILDHATLATPHIAGYSLQGKANASAMAIRALADHFNLPLTTWYPEGITPTIPRHISWEELCRTIDKYCPIIEQTSLLKAQPTLFEDMRNNYHYREEYF